LPRKESSIASSKVGKRPAPQFRQRYDALEAHRAQLLGRLAKLGDTARKHSGFNSAMKLLNDRFRRATLAQRATILQSAAWMIDVLEHLATYL